MQSEFLRERVRQAVGWGIEDAWPRYNRIHEPHDPDDESRQEWVDCITEQVVTALLRTPHDPDRQTTQWYCPEGCGCVLDSRSARYHDCRRPASDGGEVRERVGAVLRRWNRLAGDVEGSDGPLTETEIAAIAQEVDAALRSAPSGVEEGEPVAWLIRDRETGRSMVTDQDPTNPPPGKATGVTMFPSLYEAIPLYAAPVPCRDGEGQEVGDDV